VGNPIEVAIKLLSSAHVATDLVWERHDCVEALKKLSKHSELDNELDRVVEWAEDLCGVGHSAWDTIDPRLIANAILEAAENLKPQRTWVGLDEEEVIDLWPDLIMHRHTYQFWQNLEAKLKQKNGYDDEKNT